MNAEPSATQTKSRLRAMGLLGLLACYDEIAGTPWLAEVLRIEEQERHKRSLERRMRHSKVGAFKPMVDFDWNWPKKLDREAVEDLFSLAFQKSGHNVVLVGPNGVGKTMILKNIAYHAISQGHTVCFTTASDMLSFLAAPDSASGLTRRLRRFTSPQLLCVDEVGYLSYDNRYADLLFEVVTRRYDAQRSILLSTNKAFAEWGQVFPHAACVVTLIDRLVHRSEIIDIEADSYRLKEAKELSATRTKLRRSKKS
jgi:DNA replication protein DnaC